MGLRHVLEQEEKHLRALLGKLDSNSKEAESSKTIRISVDKGRCRYYIKNNRGKYEYVTKENMGTVNEMIQKQYNDKAIRLIKKRLSQFQKILIDYDEREIDNLFDEMHDERKKIVVPMEPTSCQLYQSWLNEPYEGKAFEQGTAVILTEKGERVRSKSEKILADYFYHNGIEYKYEKPLYLKGIGIVYPDFTFWSKKLSEEIYWEHDGKMDDPVYAKTAVKKVNAYISNGILPTDRLILTYETAATPLQMECVENLLRKYLL